jgi:hypothetical protein
MRNPYASARSGRTWEAVDYYAGSRIVHGRFWFRWQARLFAMGVLKVEEVA